MVSISAKPAGFLSLTEVALRDSEFLPLLSCEFSSCVIQYQQLIPNQALCCGPPALLF